MPSSTSSSVDVVVPVHGAADDFVRCAESVFSHTDLRRHRFVVVVDGDPAFAADALLERRAAETGADLLVLRNPVRRGFVASVNRGMALAERDVVLLNSDAEVTAGWLDKMAAAAHSAADVASVTPFSNNATICSLPCFLANNVLPAGHDLAGFARVVEERAQRVYPRLPTGVGVCLYLRRDALDAVGLFDEARFGLGYGEESEWCMRAWKVGRVHVLDDATFVWHAGQRSFGATRARRVRHAQRVMRRLHPEYDGLVARFIREDPLRPVRERVMAALLPPRRATPATTPRRVLHVVHGWPPWNAAGTESYARGLVVRQARDREVVVSARIGDPEAAEGGIRELQDGGARVRLVVNNFTQRNPLVRNALLCPALDREIGRLLDETRPEIVHVHHLAGHALSIVAAVARRGIPIVWQAQDWWLACARSNLLDATRQLCPGPAPRRCARCLPLTRRPPASVWNPLLHAVRRRLAHRALRAATAFIFGSRFAADSWRMLGLVRAADVLHVLPYGVEMPVDVVHREPARLPLRFGILGSFLPHKGLHVAVEAFRGVDPACAVLDAWGTAAADAAYMRELEAVRPPSVRLHPPFPEAEKDAVLAALDVLLAPSLGLESFGLAVREAMARGVPVVASRAGALPEAFDGDTCGAFVARGDAVDLRRVLDRLIATPALVDRWRRHLPAVKGMDEHAREIDAVYAEVLARHR
jgi:GT2 family glycosyltransferase